MHDSKSPTSTAVVAALAAAQSPSDAGLDGETLTTAEYIASRPRPSPRPGPSRTLGRISDAVHASQVLLLETVSQFKPPDPDSDSSQRRYALQTQTPTQRQPTLISGKSSPSIAIISVSERLLPFQRHNQRSPKPPASPISLDQGGGGLVPGGFGSTGIQVGQHINMGHPLAREPHASLLPLPLVLDCSLPLLQSTFSEVLSPAAISIALPSTSPAPLIHSSNTTPPSR